LVVEGQQLLWHQAANGLRALDGVHEPVALRQEGFDLVYRQPASFRVLGAELDRLRVGGGTTETDADQFVLCARLTAVKVHRAEDKVDLDLLQAGFFHDLAPDGLGKTFSLVYPPGDAFNRYLPEGDLKRAEIPA
jgi:hypothetical protein